MDNKHIYNRYVSSPVGKILLQSDGKSLIGLSVENQTGYSDNLPESEYDCNGILDNAEKWLEIYFSGKEPDFIPTISFSDTPFRQAVWHKLLNIPYGKTTTYGQIANQIAAESGMERLSAQAVGNAVGKNPVSVIVPCHRVLGFDGSLTGYNGGIEIKKLLLDIEKIQFKK